VTEIYPLGASGEDASSQNEKTKAWKIPSAGLWSRLKTRFRNGQHSRLLEYAERIDQQAIAPISSRAWNRKYSPNTDRRWSLAASRHRFVNVSKD